MDYRIYANIEVWKQIAIKDTLEEAIKVVDDIVAQEIKDFIVVESSRENGDVPIIANMRSYLRIKKELEESKKSKRLIYEPKNVYEKQ